LIDRQVSATRGVCHGFYGDKLYASWNAASVCFEHEYRACTSALQIVNTLNAVTNPKLKEDGFDEIVIRIGIASGEGMTCFFSFTLKFFQEI
jgi:class 3 adenylate cyclase